MDNRIPGVQELIRVDGYNRLFIVSLLLMDTLITLIPFGICPCLVIAFVIWLLFIQPWCLYGSYGYPFPLDIY